MYPFTHPVLPAAQGTFVGQHVPVIESHALWSALGSHEFHVCEQNAVILSPLRVHSGVYLFVHVSDTEDVTALEADVVYVLETFVPPTNGTLISAETFNAFFHPVVDDFPSLVV